MSLDWLPFSEKNQTTEKQESFWDINTDHILVESQSIKDIRKKICW